MCYLILFIRPFCRKSEQTRINRELEPRSLIEMEEWLCVQVVHHKRISKTIHEHQEKGWMLHTYEATANDGTIYHYLLFTRDTNYNLNDYDI